MSITLAMLNKFVKSLKDKDLEDRWCDSKCQSGVKKLLSCKTVSDTKIKDPNAPKKNLSAYMCFFRSERNNIVQENPGYKTTEIATEMGVRWTAIKATPDVAKYQKMADDDKKRYMTAMEGYTPPASCVVKSKKDGPKKGKTSYFHFCSDEREKLVEQNPGMKNGDIAKIMGIMWKELKTAAETDETKSEKLMSYIKRAGDDSAKYKSEKEKYANKCLVGDEEIVEECVKQLPVANSAFHLYSADNRNKVKQENQESSTSEITQILTKNWKALSKSDKQTYKDRM
jgi:hypothetical protein